MSSGRFDDADTSGRSLTAGHVSRGPASSLLHSGDAVLLVDVQNDFCEGGPIGIAGTDAMVDVLNDWVDAGIDAGLGLFACRDWHPAEHVSFDSYGAHCVQGTAGADFHHRLHVPPAMVVVEKGYDAGHDSLSGFGGTTLAVQLRSAGVRRLWVGGLAFEGCVLATVRDALTQGFEVAMIPLGSGAFRDSAVAETVAELVSLGVRVVEPGPVALT